MDPARVALLVQARMSSSRLPGKVLLPLAGAPAIVRMIERLRRVTRAGAIVVATSTDGSDDPLVDACEAADVRVSRGSLDDVLGRLARAAPPECDVLVRLTADCPLVDPALVDRHLAVFEAQRDDSVYVANAVTRTFPDGLDVEVVSRRLLIAAAREASVPYDREHVTPWIQRHARHVPILQDVDLSAVRWVLDTPGDYEAVAAIYDALHPRVPQFGPADIYRLQVGRPDLVRLAGEVARDEIVGRIEQWLAREERA